MKNTDREEKAPHSIHKEGVMWLKMVHSVSWSGLAHKQTKGALGVLQVFIIELDISATRLPSAAITFTRLTSLPLSFIPKLYW